MKHKILIIDDETDFCGIMKSYFTKKGYDVSLAYTLKDGLILIREWRPDILFLDNNLPDAQGWDAVEEIVEIIPQSRVFLISAHKNRSALKTRGSHHLTVWEKPISISTLENYF